MTDLRELYQELILEHSRKPRNFRTIEGGERKADGHNPLCGDRLTVYATVDDGRVTDAAFRGAGCAICMASASVMTDAVRGRSEQEAEELFRDFQEIVVSGEVGMDDMERFGRLAAFAGVGRFPMRVKCATLAWHTLRAALKSESEPVTTE